MNRSRGTLELWLAGTALLAPLLVLCVQFLDLPLALFIKNHFYRNPSWSRLTSNLPDLLLVVVLLTTCFAFFLYRVRVTRGIFDPLTSLARLLAWATPASYLVKVLLKGTFGRINTRNWVANPENYGFHWLHGGEGFEGFPSGHMLVAVTILACLWRFYPGCRRACLCAATLLGGALVVTNYHFLSDVIAGGWCGLLVEAITFHTLAREPRRLGFPAI